MQLSTKIFKQEVQFVAGVAKVNQFPKLFLPQFVFMGKSNVGKSSLINKVCNRKALARVSHTPGRTQQINFFSIAGKLLLVDLPGYGFAKVSGNQRKNWEKLITYYLENGEHIRTVNLLIDSRRGIRENDIQIMHLLQSINKNVRLIFTKADKIKAIDDFIVDTKAHLKALGFDYDIIVTSSRSGAGTRELQLSMVQSI